jgi:hypothetical protein
VIAVAASSLRETAVQSIKMGRNFLIEGGFSISAVFRPKNRKRLEMEVL